MLDAHTAKDSSTASLGACRRLTARAKFARTCFRPAISPMLKPKEIHNPISPVENEDWTNDFDTCVECEANV
jgi:hypothetical protein